MIIDTVSVIDGQLRTADDRWHWPNPMGNVLVDFGVKDGEYLVELEMTNKVPTRLIIHFDRQPDRSA